MQREQVRDRDKAERASQRIRAAPRSPGRRGPATTPLSATRSPRGWRRRWSATPSEAPGIRAPQWKTARGNGKAQSNPASHSFCSFQSCSMGSTNGATHGSRPGSLLFDVPK